jgi:hydrogenase maturation protein HypF
MVYGVGRLFDAVASIIGLRQACSFEAQAAMQLEFEGEGARKRMGPKKVRPYPYELKGKRPIVVDWRPMVRTIVQDSSERVGQGEISLRFHATLAEVMLEVANRIGDTDVALSGGVFQNALLCSMVSRAFEGHNFKLHSHSLLPPNDGCISVGQVAIALARGW